VIDLIVGGISIATLIGIIYWVQRTFVSEKTCKARQDCLEGKIDKLAALSSMHFMHIEKLIKGLIKKHGDGQRD